MIPERPKDLDEAGFKMAIAEATVKCFGPLEVSEKPSVEESLVELEPQRLYVPLEQKYPGMQTYKVTLEASDLRGHCLAVMRMFRQNRSNFIRLTATGCDEI